MGRRYRYQVAALIVLGICIPVYLVLSTKSMESDRLELEYESRVGKWGKALNDTVRICEQEMESVGAFFAASEEVNREEFERFCRVILQNPHSLQALEWVPRVSHEDRAGFEALRSSLVSHPFTLTERNRLEGAHEKLMVEAGVRAEYHPVDFIVPWNSENEKAFGYDLGSDSARLAALQEARDKGDLSATEPIQLVQDEESVQDGTEPYSFLLFKPIYRKRSALTTTAERRAALQGHIVGLFKVEEMVRQALEGILDDGVEVKISHIDSKHRRFTLFSMSAPAPDQKRRPGSVSTQSVPLRVANKKWEATFAKVVGFEDQREIQSTSVLAASGAFLALALALIIRNSQRHTKSIEKARQDLKSAVDQKNLALEEALLLDTITAKIEQGRSLTEILDYIFESFHAIMPYDRIGFAMIDQAPHRIRSIWAKSGSGVSALDKGYTAPLKGSSLEEVIRTRTPRIINDLADYYRNKPNSESTRLVLKEKMRSSLTCPLIAMEKPVGFLFFSHRNPNTYDKSHVQVFMRTAGHVSRIVEKAILFDSLEKEQAKSEKLLTSILPSSVVSRLKEESGYLADQIQDATIVFADIVGFTDWAGACRPEHMVRQLGEIFEVFDKIARDFNVQKIGTHGDLYLAGSGLPASCDEHTENVADFSLAIQDAIGRFQGYNGQSMRLRIGIHSGPVVAGVTGKWAFRYDVWGSTVNLASRLESTSEPGRIQVSETIWKRLSKAYFLEPRGTVNLKGFGERSTYWLNEKIRQEPASSAPQTIS